MENEEVMFVCEDCMCTIDEMQPCAYNSEMGGCEDPIWICDDCNSERAMDV